MFNIIERKTSDVDMINELRRSTRKEFGEEELKVINEITENGLDPSYFKDKLVTFSSILKGATRVSAIDYIKAVQYCSYIAVGDSQANAYRKTFPDRVAKKASPNTVISSASFYHRGSMVQQILSSAQIPLHLIFMAEKYKAIEKLADLMVNADTARIQMESADKLLTHLKSPENTKLEIDIGFKKNETLDNLEKTLAQLATKQVEMIGKGYSAQDVVDAKIITNDEDEEY